METKFFESKEYYIFNIPRILLDITNREDVFLDVYGLFITLTNITYRQSELESYSVDKLDDIWIRLTALEQFFQFNKKSSYPAVTEQER